MVLSCSKSGSGIVLDFSRANDFNALTLFCYRHLVKLPLLLESEDVNMRIAAGETIALLFELARDVDSVSCEFYYSLNATCCVIVMTFKLLNL